MPVLRLDCLHRAGQLPGNADHGEGNGAAIGSFCCLSAVLIRVYLSSTTHFASGPQPITFCQVVANSLYFPSKISAALL